MTQVGWSDYTACQCCGLLAPRQFMLPWTRRVVVWVMLFASFSLWIGAAFVR